MNIICFIAGMIIGTFGLLFVQGANKTSREHEIYTEGYKAGLAEIERENPKKPYQDENGEVCPMCNRYVWGYVKRMNYCSGCGQKIDWGE